MTRLLLVDDHQLLRQGLRRAMEEAGFAVVGEASDGEEALTMAEGLRPEVVLMDITMPVLDGIEATRQMRERCPGARVVVLSMHGEEETIAQAMRAGAVGYLTKDCSMAEVAETVRLAATGEGAAVSPGIASSILSELAPAPQVPSVLSKREEEVLQLFADGCSPTEVAARLFISAKTVKNHLASIYEKLDARDRTQAVLRAVRMGIVRID
ncbi:MAG: response regulator transcription factor [Acidimicrobiia bacterium]